MPQNLWEITVFFTEFYCSHVWFWFLNQDWIAPMKCSKAERHCPLLVNGFQYPLNIGCSVTLFCILRLSLLDSDQTVKRNNIFDLAKIRIQMVTFISKISFIFLFYLIIIYKMDYLLNYIKWSIWIFFSIGYNESVENRFGRFNFLVRSGLVAAQVRFWGSAQHREGLPAPGLCTSLPHDFTMVIPVTDTYDLARETKREEREEEIFY